MNGLSPGTALLATPYPGYLKGVVNKAEWKQEPLGIWLGGGGCYPGLNQTVSSRKGRVKENSQSQEGFLEVEALEPGDEVRHICYSIRGLLRSSPGGAFLV